LQHDPHELTNLITSEAHTPVREVMRGRLLRRMEALNEPLPTIVEPENVESILQRVVTEAETLA
ncbi:MAG: arylsulfatase, partial [Planctomycetota bacterium]